MRKRKPKFETRWPVAVIAGNEFQFEDYCKRNRHPPGDAVLIVSMEDAKGRRFRSVVTCGTYYRLENWQELFSGCSLK